MVIQTSSSVGLVWTDPNVTEVGYEIERASDLGAFVPVAAVGKNVQTWTDSAPVVTAPLTLTYRVRARGKKNAVSPWSNSMATIITPAQVPAPDPVNRTLTFVWNANAEPEVTGYLLKIGRASEDYSEPDEDQGLVTTGTYVVEVGSGAWYFTLHAYTDTQISPPATEVSITV